MSKAYVFVTISGGIAEYAAEGKVEVILLDYDNFESPSESVLEELEEYAKDVRALPQTGVIGQHRANALESLAALYDQHKAAQEEAR